MFKAHGPILLNSRSVPFADESGAWEAALFLPQRAQGTVIFSGLPGEPGTPAALLYSLVHAGLGVLAIPKLPGRRLLHAASFWLSRQAWASHLSWGLLACGPLAAEALDFAGRTEKSLRAMVIYNGDPDMCEAGLDAIRIPVLFAASGENSLEAELNQEMANCLGGECHAVVLDGKPDPPGLLTKWFVDHFEAQRQAGLCSSGTWLYQGHADAGKTPATLLTPEGPIPFS